MIDFGTPSIAETAADIRSKITEAELLRENGHIKPSKILLSKQILRAAEIGNDELKASALAQQIINFKHLYQNTKEYFHLVEMQVLIAEGMDLELSNAQKAVFHLRKGDLQTFNCNYDKAHFEYKTALKNTKSHTLEHAEYLCHFGESYIPLGEYDKARLCIRGALEAMKKVTEIRDWHRLVVESRMWGCYSKVCLHQFRIILALKYAKKYWLMARELRDKHGKAQRLNQFYQQMPMGRFLRLILERGN